MIIILLLASTACNPSLSKVSDEDREGTPGSARDEHNCLSSGGYSWSVVKNDCIRFWEAGIELTNALNPNSGSVGYLITSSVSESVELILPGLAGSTLLHKTDGNWVDSKKRYVLSQSEDGTYQLHNNQGKLLYQSNKP
ncbi:MAG: hypothetical protein Roseis2KO_29340 [Roseivirga sp.]